jgi:hypothetical protein
VTAALTECGIWRESKTCESSERDQGSNKTKSAHNLSLPSSVVADFQLRSLEISKALSNRFSAGVVAETRAARGNPHY